MPHDSAYLRVSDPLNVNIAFGGVLPVTQSCGLSVLDDSVPVIVRVAEHAVHVIAQESGVFSEVIVDFAQCAFLSLHGVPNFFVASNMRSNVIEVSP